MFDMFPPTMLGGFKEPPTLYSLMESMVNYNKVNKTPIKDLCKEARLTIFDFSYPLSEKVNKEDFECMILNHFITRRIGFTVYTPWRIALETKLNEIMPFYNKMFDLLDGWDIFKDGETTERIVEDSRTTENVSNSKNITNTETNSNSSSKGYTEKTVSDTPQNQLDDIRDNKYADDFEHSNNNASSQDNSNSKGISNTNNSSNTNDRGNLKETIKRSPADKMKLYSEYLENKNHIYSLIFSELNCLFYGLV